MEDPKRPVGRPPNPPKRIKVLEAVFKDGVTLPDGSHKHRIAVDAQIGKVDRIMWYPEWRAIEITLGERVTMVGFGPGVSIRLDAPVDVRSDV